MGGRVVMSISKSNAFWDRGPGAWSSTGSRQKAGNRVMDGGTQEPPDSLGQELQRGTRWGRGQNAERWKPESGTLLRKDGAEILLTNCQGARQIRFQKVLLRASDTLVT